MKVESVLVTGANRGIGFEFIKQFTKLDDPPKFIFATYRNPQTIQELTDIKESSTKSQVILIKLDTTSAEDIEETKKVVEKTVGDRGLNLLINNAGILKPQSFPKLTPENMEMQFKANCVAPVMILQAFYPLLEKASIKSIIHGKRASKAAVINMTSRTASIQKTGDEGAIEDLIVPGYKISKVALNMAMRVIAASVQDRDVLVVNMCPGWVKTEMGTREYGKIEAEESIADMFGTFPKLDESHHGAYIDRFGEPHLY